MKTRPLDHIGIAVHSIDDAAKILGPLAAAVPRDREIVHSQGVEVAFLGEGDGTVELLAPARPDTAIARHLERRGPGLHHLAYRVSDIRTALAEARDAGYILVDHEPRPGAGGHLVAFLHPRSTAGVLIELVQHAEPAG